MCNTDFNEFLQKLPKCEHHVHLEGTLMPEHLFQLAKKNNVELPTNMGGYESPEMLLERYNRFTDLQDFLDYYYVGMSVLKTEEDFEELAWKYFLKAKNDGVVHAEVFYDPQAHLERGHSVHKVTQGFNKACMRAEKELGISTRLIMCFLRHLPPADAVKVFNDSQHFFAQDLVHGIGLDSAELPFPPELFEDVFLLAKNSGIKRTAHAGEEGDWTYISRAIKFLDVKRIDHGINLVQNKELLAELAEKKTLLTVCPLSNVKLQCVKSVAELPIRELLDSKVHFSINSDDPAYFGGFILDNYYAVQAAFNLSILDWKFIASASINGSWISDESKDKLLADVEKIVSEFS